MTAHSVGEFQLDFHFTCTYGSYLVVQLLFLDTYTQFVILVHV